MTSVATLLPDLKDVEPFSQADEALFAELREILKQHDALHRFGVVLLHQHFPIDPGERLVEFVDIENRTLTIRPVLESTHGAATAIQTQWRLDRPSPTLGCEQWCYEDPATGEHLDTGHQKDDDDDD